MSEREEMAAWAEKHARGFGASTEFDRRIARLAALLREPPSLPTEPPAGFVRARIAVATREDGNYCARGSSYEDEDDSIADARDGCELNATPASVVWVTVDVPLPKPIPEIVGAVTK